MRALLAVGPLERAVFVERLNRFLLRSVMGSREGRAYLANPGRLGEILLPGTELLLARRPHTKIGWEAVGATWSKRWPGDRPRSVFLNASRMNDLAEQLLEGQLIPQLRSYRIEKREVSFGGSRFDFLLSCWRQPHYLLEVKSVTLAEHGLALFPDARTERGRRHLEELARISSETGWRTGVLFLVQGRAERFLPDFHNDLEFARTFHSLRRRLEFLPYRLDPALSPGGGLVFSGEPRRLPIPWSLLDTVVADAGLYLLVLTVPTALRLQVGMLGFKDFRRGFYVYIGSAKRGLSRRLSRHSRSRKRFHYHVDALRARSSRVVGFPIRGAIDECGLAREVARIGSRTIERFGSSDCRCPGHLVYFPDNPVRRAPFQELLTRIRHRWWNY